MQSVTLVLAVLALVVGVYAAIISHHIPLHEEENERLHRIETWIRSRCAPGVSLEGVCTEIQMLPPHQTTRHR